MMDLKTYGYTEIEAIPHGLLPGRVTELQRERFTVMTKRGEITAVLKGTFYHSAETRVDYPCVGDFVLLHYNESGNSLIVSRKLYRCGGTVPSMPFCRLQPSIRAGLFRSCCAC
ncbi:hypothetical protein [Paenibacillus monticola]|uniref:hypothetical protein n=1 Tax=Paenibacillus monticola TaxID=2666075 RepID=UPI001E5ECEC7|nr:hypothetical protein [Paenibacillus monticola]